MAARKTPVRDAAKLETREALLRAGMDLFAAEGLDAPSLDAICARAGYTRGAFYVHFEGREDFIVAVMQHATGSFLDAILAGTSGKGFDLERAVEAFSAMASAKPGELRSFGRIRPHQFLAACARSPELRRGYVAFVREAEQRVARAVRKGQKAGRLRRDVDAQAVSQALVALVLGVETLADVAYPVDVTASARAVLQMLRADPG